MAGKTVVPLYAAADEAAVRDVLGELKKKGFRVRQSAEAKKSEVLLVFLSAAFAADGAAQERFLAADSAGREIVPIDLDGAPQPELVHGALMARNAITAQGRTAEEIAARVATAPAFAEKKLSGPLGRVLLAAAALLVLGAALWLWKSAPARAEKRETAAILAAAQAKYGLSEEDLAEIQYVYFVADRFYHYTGEDMEDFRWNFASNSMEDDGMHWYDPSDGHRLGLTKYSAEELAILRMMPKLKGIDMILVDAEALPALNASTTLEWIELIDSSITDISGLAGSSLITIHSFRCPIEDYSVLTDCEQLTYATMEFDFLEKADLSGFSPPALAEARFGYGRAPLELDLSGLKDCAALETLTVECLPCGTPDERYPLVDDLGFLTGLTNLKDLTLNDLAYLTDVSALGTLPALETLTISECRQITELSALANASALREVRIENCDAIRDFSPLGSCRALEKLSLHSDALRDASFLSGLPELRDVDLRFRQLPNVDFLADIAAGGGLRLELSGDVTDFSGLAERERYDYLFLAPSGGSADAALAYLRDATVDHLRVDGCRIDDLAAFPQVTDALELWYCELGDLSTLPAWPVKDVNLVGLATLTSLDGLEHLPILQKGGGLMLGVRGCPHLRDWSALEGRTLKTLKLTDLAALPELGSIEFAFLSLERCEALTDLHFLDAKPAGWKYREISLLGQDALRDLSPLRRVKGNHLIVGPELADQARELFESGAVEKYEISYPEGIWHFNEEDVTLLDIGELDTLSPSLLGRVRELCLVGDRVVDLARSELFEDDGSVVLRDRDGGEETALTPEDGLTDLSALAPLTGLRRLTLWDQPLGTLEGVQALGELETLELRGCPALTDASAAFTLQGLRELRLRSCPLASVRGVRNLTELEELDLAGTGVDDLSPLLGMEKLRRVTVSSDMTAAAASLEGSEYGFELIIEGEGHE